MKDDHTAYMRSHIKLKKFFSGLAISRKVFGEVCLMNPYLMILGLD